MSFRATSRLQDFFDGSYQIQRLPNGSDRTAHQYAVQLRHFSRWLGHAAKLTDLTDASVSAFMREHAKGREAPTANKAYWCLVALWRYAADLGILKTRPTIPPLIEPERAPLAWTLDELRRLLRACQEEQGNIDGVLASSWWTGLHWVLWSTGERRSATMAIETARTDIVRGEVIVPAEVRKGKRRDMVYRLLPQAVEHVSAIYSLDRQLLFPWPYCPETIYNHYKRILKRAGLPSDRKCKFQRMRRSFASHLEANGGNATEALGHSTRRVTRKSYLDLRICGGQNPAALLPKL
ncbi:MAG: site-specific integrase [Patescibacteria group bacterium]|nr:site-specific integrase [Patescibacteria group bacterium]